jgi:cardiolipin synthase
MLHAKVMLTDQTLAMVGSANLDSRSLFLNYEVATFFYSEDDILAVKTWIEGIAAESVTGIGEAGRMRSLFEGVAQVIAPQI